MGFRHWIVAAAGMGIMIATRLLVLFRGRRRCRSSEGWQARCGGVSLGGTSAGGAKGYTMLVRGEDGGAGITAIELVDLRR